jgi:hypothetical protein
MATNNLTIVNLGRNGAYDGLKVVISQEYIGEGFTGELPVAALREKGFEVAHLKVRNKAESNALSLTLEEHLETASQVWLISTSYNLLEDSHLDLIVHHWQLGLGVYIFGDNDPFYADANQLLARMSVCMTAEEQPNSVSKKGRNVQLSGNTRGDSVVSARTNDRGPGFFPNHLVVTGISQLYEGVTVSTMDGDMARSMGFEEILREHSGDLVVVARPSINGYGPIMVDGAFTKLFCHWGRGGSARFVRNCACWLSTLTSADEKTELAAAAKSLAVAAPPKLNLDNAYTAECSISLEDGPAALLAAALADVDQNTTDFALDNNLALGRQNRVLGSQLLAVNVVKLFLEQGANPFTRQSVAAVLPLVSLADEGNKQLVAEVARQLFMGGRAMDRHAFNILLSVLEEMLHRQPDHPDALRFMISQILRHAVSTPDMLKGVPGGPTVPLEQGLKNNVTITGELVPLRKAFAHVSRSARLLSDHASESARLSPDTLRLVVRRSLLKTILGAAARFAKQNDETEEGIRSNGLTQKLDSLVFDQQLGIPVAGTAKLISLPQLGGIVEQVVQHTNIPEIIEDAERTATALGGGLLVSDAELTMSLLLLRQRAEGLWRTLIEPLLTELKEDSSVFRSLWDAPTHASVTATAPDKVQEFANLQLTGSFVVEPEEHARISWPGFATPFGPSVYRCKCGCVFGDPNEELTEETLLALRQSRNCHFAKMFVANENGYPTSRSAHFPLHRAVQRVLTRPRFQTATSRSDDMEWEVAKYLRKAKRGNIHTLSIQADIQFAIDTYLECRQKGMPEPKPDAPIGFYKKAASERQLILTARSSASGKGDEWIDRQRRME